MPENRQEHTSLEIAEAFGKRHSNVLRDISVLQKRVNRLPPAIRLMVEFRMDHRWIERGIWAISEDQPLKYKQPFFVLNRPAFALLVLGYTCERHLESKATLMIEDVLRGLSV